VNPSKVTGLGSQVIRTVREFTFRNRLRQVASSPFN
jgi:hypothetical protein